jgi:hypothetical protein
MSKKPKAKVKGGRKYKSIPEGYDVETWDKMTPIERMKALDLIDREYPPIDFTGNENWLTSQE